MFLIGLRNAKREKLDIANSVYKVLKYNVDVFYVHFAAKNHTQIAQIVKEICRGVTTASDIQEYNRALAKLTVDFGFLCDAFYTKRPFKLRIFVQVISQMHKTIRDTFEIRWNAASDTIQTADCLSLAETMFGYLNLMTKWGLTDRYFKGWEKPILNRFLYALFQKSKELMVNILTEIQTSHYLNEGKLMSSSLDGFENHLSFVVSHYSKIPMPSFGIEICKYVGRVASMFFMNLREFLLKPAPRKEFCMVILNSNLFKTIRSSQKSVASLTKNQVNIDIVKSLMNDDYLLFVFQKIHDAAKVQLKKSMSAEFVTAEAQKRKSFWTFNVAEFADQLVENMKRVFALLINDFLFKDIAHSLFKNLLVEYIKCICQCGKDFSPADSKRLLDKVAADCEVFRGYCHAGLMNRPEELVERIDVLESFFHTKSVDVTIAQFIKMQYFYHKKIPGKQLIELVQAKCFFMKEVKSYIIEYTKTDANYKPLRQTEEAALRAKNKLRTAGWFVMAGWICFRKLSRKVAPPSHKAGTRKDKHDRPARLLRA